MSLLTTAKDAVSRLQRLVLERQLPTPEIAGLTRQIYRHVLADSPYLENGNFRRIHPTDLERLFSAYDRTFFEGLCRELTGPSLSFRLASRMTRAGGKTTQRTYRRPVPRVTYEIAMSTTLLFQTFHDVDRPILVSGVECRDRLEAMQRVFEHEMVHLAEMLAWNDSSCSQPRFQSISRRLFGHTQHTHQLVTQHERAFVKFGVKAGDQVSFRFDGQHYVGRVNRITRRATVLVEDPRGMRYTNGKRYRKFYVPLADLEPVDES